MGDLVVGGPIPLDQWVGAVFLSRPLKGVRISQADAAGRIVRGIIHVIAPERFLEVLIGLDDARDDNVIARVVLQASIIQHDALVMEDRESIDRSAE
jgi:hypothetical protein